MSRYKKLLLSFLSFLILFASSLPFFSAPEVKAQNTNPWYNQTFPQWYTKVYDTSTSPPQEIFGERYTAAQVQWVLYSLVAMFPNMAQPSIICILKGGDTNSCADQNPLVSENTVTLPQDNRSVFAVLFNPNRAPSGVNYVREKLASLSIIPEAHAQNAGFGFYALGPVENIWRECRDVMYGLFVLIIIVFAFMIMFRVRLNPQTVVTIQTAIPKIIITLILVTFSYAIAGLMIDLMYVAIGLLALIFTQFGFIAAGTGTWSKIFSLMTDGPGGFLGVGGIIGWMVGICWAIAVSFFSTMGYFFSLGGAGNAGIGAIVFILAILLTIGVFVWLILTIGKVFILLIKTYIQILISVIFSPFIIGFGAIAPTGGFSGWLKGLVSSLAVYPTAAALLMLCVLFLGATYTDVRNNLESFLQVPAGSITNIFSSSTNSSYWYPPLTLGVQSTTTGWDPLPVLWTFAAIAIMGTIPNVANMIKSVMSGKGIEGGGGIGAGLAAVGGYALGTARRAGGAYFSEDERALQNRIAEFEARSREEPGGRPVPAGYGSWDAYRNAQREGAIRAQRQLQGVQATRRRLGV